ncbi:MAG: tyrosine-type recombinase/integrase, partial [Bacilli bacterium]
MKKVIDLIFFELVREYLCNYLPNVRKRSECTLKTSRDSINEFINFLQATYTLSIFEISIEQFNEKELCKFGTWLIEAKQNLPSTANLRISRLQAFAKYLVQYCSVEYVSQISKVSKINKFPEPKSKIPKSLTLDEVKILFTIPNQGKKLEFRDYCFITLMYDSACRDNEIRSLRLKDITIEDNIGILRIHGKGNKTRLTPITKDVVSILRNYITKFHPNRNPEDYLFFSNTKKGNKMSNDNTLRILKKYSIRAREKYPNYPHVHSHVLRHSR